MTAPLVVAALTLPPPVNGQAIINASFANALQATGVTLKLINTSPNSHKRSLFYHLQRISVISAVPIILCSNVLRSKRNFYTAVAPGHGIYYSVLMVASARLFGYAIFLHHHSSSYTKVVNRCFHALAYLAGRNATHIALSEQMASDLKTRYPSCQRVVFAHNACHLPDPGSCRPIHKNDNLTIGFLSNLSLEKGLDTVLQCFEEIRSHGVRARLFLAGPIVEEKARAAITKARSNFGEAIVELGSVSGERKEAFFESIDLFLFPSRYRFEAQPLVVLEALSFGVPTIATRHGYMAEILDKLGTSTDARDFVAFSVEFARSFMKDSHFADVQRGAARARFVELAESSHSQHAQLLALITAC